MTRNQILYQQNVEQNRSNLAREAETARANKAAETENYRSHLAVESETARHNQEMERENNRSNLARELENNRHNTSAESLQRQANAEQARSNRANESLKHEANLISEGNSLRSAEAQMKSASIGAAAQKYSADANVYGTQYRSDTQLVSDREQRASNESINREKEFGLSSRQSSDQLFQSQQNAKDRANQQHNAEYTADKRAQSQIISSTISAVGHLASSFINLKGAKSNGKENKTKSGLDKLYESFSKLEYQYDEQGRPKW